MATLTMAMPVTARHVVAKATYTDTEDSRKVLGLSIVQRCRQEPSVSGQADLDNECHEMKGASL